MKFALAVALLGASFPAAAHDFAARGAGRHPDTNVRYLQYRDVPPPPHWQGRTRADWRRHVQACLDRFPSYNPRTDRYIDANSGDSPRCPL